jgi:ubiquitin-conjugating enzyme E2 variant
VFRLLAEMEKGGSGFYTYGLEKGKIYLFILLADDNTFTYWNASIIGPNERIYELKLLCGEDYPEKPPKIKFVTKINMPAVNQTTGWVDIAQLAPLKNWTKNNTIENALEAIRKEMETQTFKKLKQPEESAVFP